MLPQERRQEVTNGFKAKEESYLVIPGIRRISNAMAMTPARAGRAEINCDTDAYENDAVVNFGVCKSRFTWIFFLPLTFLGSLFFSRELCRECQHHHSVKHKTCQAGSRPVQ